MESSKFLKVMGIIMLIFGIIAIIGGLLSLMGIGMVVSLAGLAGVTVPVELLTASLVIALVSAIFELIAGILGIKNWNVPEKVNSCMICGILTVALCVVSIIMTLVGYPDSFSILSIVTGLIVPILYLIAAFQYKAKQ
ncbi:hypothetical protein CE91St36_01790 [Christensenellaceae bacterium]|nr:hypothetical protein CE91St36_01790 [Christensenellaceae bacterium]BDF60030.1 hypothetical protein CE91St37_01800 [Christensenellaceae bacterium]